MEGPKRGNITGKGQEPTSLKDCTEYSFVIQGKNFDSNTRLNGTLKVKESKDENPKWTAVGPGEVSATYDVEADYSALTYNLSGQAVHNLQTWRYTSAEISANDVEFDWEYSGFHAWYRAWIKITLEMEKKDGTVDTKVLMEGEKRGNFTGEGQEHVSLRDCKQYAFVIQGKNFDRDTRLLGTLKVKEDPYGKGEINWQTDGPGEVSAKYNAQTDNSALSYKLTGNEVHSLQTWRFANKDIGKNNVLFAWDYSGFHAWFQAYIKIVLELKLADGTVKVVKLMEGERRGNITGKGQEVVDLKDYTEYAFVIQGKNYDSDTRLFGTLNVEVREV